jgi:antitoxin ParD1/3/4
MNVSLTPKLEDFVKSKVKTGDYSNASEVVREALRLLQKEDDATHDRKVATLRRAIQAGIDSPDDENFDIKKVIGRLKKRRKS